jgi:hypothetical protein
MRPAQADHAPAAQAVVGEVEQPVVLEGAVPDRPAPTALPAKRRMLDVGHRQRFRFREAVRRTRSGGAEAACHVVEAGVKTLRSPGRPL